MFACAGRRSVVAVEVEPRGHHKGDDGQAKQHGGEAEPPLRECVRPRHAVAGDVPPAVDAGEREREHQQQLRPRTWCGCGASAARRPRPRPRSARPANRRCPRTHRSGGSTWWGEHHEEDGSEHHAEQAPGRADRRARNPALAAQQHEQGGEQAEDHHQEREPAGHRPVDRLHEQVVVPEELLVPVHVRADQGAHPGGLADPREGLVGEHHDEHHRAGRQQRGQTAARQPTSRCLAGPGSGPSAGRRRAARRRPHQAGRRGAQRERGDHDRDRGGQQPAGRRWHAPPSTRSAARRAPRSARAAGRCCSAIQNARNTSPPVHTAARAVPDRATEARDHLAADHHPAEDAGEQRGQAHPGAGRGDRGHRGQHLVVPAERRLGDAEPAEVVGHVAGVLRHPGHRQQVAVVGGVRADEVPQHQGRGDQDVQWPDRPPSRWKEPPVPHPVGGVQHVQRAERDDRHRHPDDHHDHLQRRRRRAVTRIHRGRELQARRGGSGQIGEDAHDLGAEVVAAALTAQGLAAIVGGRPLDEPDEIGGDLVGVRVNVIFWHAGLSTWSSGAMTTGVSHDDENVVVDPLDQRPGRRPWSPAWAPWTTGRSLPAFSGPASPAAALHGTLIVRSVATYPISGALTLCSTPFCGQLSWAVVCLTGKNGVASASTAPSSPAMMATSRAVR